MVVCKQFLAVGFGIVVDQYCSSVIDKSFVVIKIKILPAIFSPVSVNILKYDVSVGRIGSLLGIWIGRFLYSSKPRFNCHKFIALCLNLLELLLNFLLFLPISHHLSW